MVIGIGTPIPDLANLPGPSRPGYPSGGGGAETKFVMEVDIPALDLDFTINTGWNSGWDGMDFNVDWGDSSSDSNVVHDITHTYATPGIKTIKIDGRFAMNNNDSGATNREKITKIKNWGTAECEFVSLYRMFYGCKFMTYEATDYPDLSNLWTAGAGRSLSELFRECEAITELDLTNWVGNMYNVNVLSSVFMRCKGLESLDITGWDFTVATGVSATFREVGSLTTNGCKIIAPNLDISNSNIFDYMFFNSKLHADTNVTGWTLRPAGQRWLGTLYGTTGDWAVNIDLTSWTNMKPTSLGSAFQGANSSDSSKVTINVTGMDTSSCTIFSTFLKDNVALTSIIGASGFSSASSGANGINQGFVKCKVLNISPSAPAANQFPSAFWSGFGNQTSWTNTFLNFGITTSYAPPTGFNTLDTSGATQAVNFFQGAGFTSNPDFSGLDFSGIVAVGSAPQYRSLYGMFYLTDGITSVDASGWNMSNGVESLMYFARSSEITSINFGSGTSNNDFSTVASIQEMVRYAPVTSIDWPTNADFSSLTAATNFCSTADVPMTTAQYDNFLTRIDATNSNTGITYSMGSCTYTGGGAVATARAAIVAAGNTIIDGGIA